MGPSDTRSLEDVLRNELDLDFSPASDSPNIKTNEVIYSIFYSSREGLAYINLTGRFPYRSAQGNEYILVAYHHDANASLAQPLKN